MPSSFDPALLTAPVSGLYAGLLALAYLVLSLRIVRLRMALQQPIGSGGNLVLARAVRAHGHFAEYVPLALVLMLLLELARVPTLLLHGYGALLLASRLLHAAGVSRQAEPPGLRLAAMVITLNLLAAAAVGLVLLWWRA